MNIDLGTGSKLYTLAVSGETANHASFSIPLVDTEGNLVACNYVDVHLIGESLGAGETLFATVELSGIGRSNIAAGLSSVSSVDPQDGKKHGKVCGFTIAAGGTDTSISTYSWHGRRDEMVKGLVVNMVCKTSTRVGNIIINYGNVVGYTVAGMPMGADRLGY